MRHPPLSFSVLRLSFLGGGKTSPSCQMHQGSAVLIEIVLDCSTCHSKFVRGSPLVPLQRPTMTGTTSSTFWYPRCRCGRNLVCDGKRSLRKWGFFSNALFSPGSGTALPTARRAHRRQHAMTLATHRAACRTRRGHNPIFRLSLMDLLSTQQDCLVPL